MDLEVNALTLVSELEIGKKYTVKKVRSERYPTRFLIERPVVANKLDPNANSSEW